jgi:hypothetical protein
MAIMRSAYKTAVGKSERKRELGRPSGRQNGNIKTEFKRNRMRECGLKSAAQNRAQLQDLMVTVINLLLA